MVKFIIGIMVVTVVTLSTGFAAAQKKPAVLGTNSTGYTKDQCKNGGWQNLTDSQGNHFKNQGDCVSFFATGGRNLGNG